MPKSVFEQDQMVDAQVSTQSPPDSIQSTLAEREKQYGEFRTQAEIAQELKLVMRQRYGGIDWSKLHPDQQEALEMIQHKIARILNGNPNHHDSWHDIAGYAQLVADRLAKDQG